MLLLIDLGVIVCIIMLIIVLINMFFYLILLFWSVMIFLKINVWKIDYINVLSDRKIKEVLVI